MSAFKSYYQAFRKDAKLEYPIWPLGETLSPGATGQLRSDGFLSNRYRFERDGLLRESDGFKPELLQVEPIPDEVFKIRSVGGTFNVDAEMAGKVDPNINVNGKINFSGDDQIYVNLEPGFRKRLTHLRDIDAVMKSSGLAKKGVCYVSEVVYASKGVVMVSSLREWDISVAGKLSALEMLDLLDPSVTFGGQNGDTVAQRFSEPVPIGIRVRGPKGILGSDVGALGKDSIPEDEEYIEISPDLLA